MKLTLILNACTLVVATIPAFAEQVQNGLLAGPLPPSPTTDLLPRAVSGPIPSIVTLSMPPALSQGNSSSCVGWALSYGMMGYYAIKFNWPNKSFSPSYVYNQAHGGSGGGTYFGDHLQIMAVRGVCPTAIMPFNPSDFQTWPTQAQAVAAHSYGFDGWQSVYTHTSRDINCVTSIKQYVANGDPVGLGINVDSTWGGLTASRSVWLPSDIETPIAGHAVVICGYNDLKGAFLVHNSYGTSWGINGQAWIPYTHFGRKFIQEFGVKIINPTYASPHVEVPITLTSVGRGAVSLQTQIPLGNSLSVRNHYFKLAIENLGLVDGARDLQASLKISGNENASWPPTPSRPWKIIIHDRIVDGKPTVISAISLLKNGSTIVTPDPYVETMADGASQTIIFTFTKRFSGNLPYGLIGPASAIVLQNATQAYSSTQNTSVEAYETIRIQPETTIRSEFRARIIPVPANG